MRTHKAKRSLRPQASKELEALAIILDERLGASINEAAAMLCVDRDTIYRMIGRGELVASKIGSRTIVHIASIKERLARTVTTKLGIRKRDVRKIEHSAT
jgi:excisionase family DNA binding protein